MKTTRTLYIPVDVDKDVSVKNLAVDTVLKELYLLIGCSLVEPVDLGPAVMMVDEVGALLEDRRINVRASILTYIMERPTYIFGDAVVMGNPRYEENPDGSEDVDIWTDIPEPMVVLLENIIVIGVDEL